MYAFSNVVVAGIKRRYLLDCIVERKLQSDLLSSLGDGRYQEQKSRLRMTGLETVIYLVESSFE